MLIHRKRPYMVYDTLQQVEIISCFFNTNGSLTYFALFIIFFLIKMPSWTDFFSVMWTWDSMYKSHGAV